MRRQPQPAPFDAPWSSNKPHVRLLRPRDAVRLFAGFGKSATGHTRPLATGRFWFAVGKSHSFGGFIPGGAQALHRRFPLWLCHERLLTRKGTRGPDAAPCWSATRCSVGGGIFMDYFGKQMPPIFRCSFLRPKKMHRPPGVRTARKNRLWTESGAGGDFRISPDGKKGRSRDFRLMLSGNLHRSLGSRPGTELGCGAHLAENLPHIGGEFSLDQAMGPRRTCPQAKRIENSSPCLIPSSTCLPNFPRTNVLPVLAKKIRHGAKFNVMPSQFEAGPRGVASRSPRRRLDTDEVFRLPAARVTRGSASKIN